MGTGNGDHETRGAQTFIRLSARRRSHSPFPFRFLHSTAVFILCGDLRRDFSAC